MRFFGISGSTDEPLKVANVTSTIRGVKAVLKIEIHTENLHSLAFAIEELAKVKAGQKPQPKAKAKPRQIAKTRQLALPAPGAAS